MAKTKDIFQKTQEIFPKSQEIFLKTQEIHQKTQPKIEKLKKSPTRVGLGCRKMSKKKSLQCYTSSMPPKCFQSHIKVSYRGKNVVIPNLYHEKFNINIQY